MYCCIACLSLVKKAGLQGCVTVKLEDFVCLVSLKTVEQHSIFHLVPAAGNGDSLVQQRCGRCKQGKDFT